MRPGKLVASEPKTTDLQKHSENISENVDNHGLKQDAGQL